MNEHPSFPYQRFVKNLYSAWLISSRSNIDLRNMQWEVPQIGWTGHFRKFTDPQIEAGVELIEFHNPHGTVDGPMELDQLEEAKETNKTFAYEGFYEGLAEYAESHPHVRFLLYFGSPRLDPTLVSDLAEAQLGDWLRRVADSLGPALNLPNVDIALDATHGRAAEFPASHPNHHITRVLKSLLDRENRELWIEPRPHADATWWHDFNVFSTDFFWNRSDPQKYPSSSAWAARNDQLTGSILRYHEKPPDEFRGQPWRWREWLPRYVAAIMVRDGHRCGVSLYHVLDGPEISGRRYVTMAELYDLVVQAAINEGWLEPFAQPEPEPEPEPWTPSGDPETDLFDLLNPVEGLDPNVVRQIVHEMIVSNPTMDEIRTALSAAPFNLPEQRITDFMVAWDYYFDDPDPREQAIAYLQQYSDLIQATMLTDRIIQNSAWIIMLYQYLTPDQVIEYKNILGIA